CLYINHATVSAFFFYCLRLLHSLHSFPTRRSSDLFRSPSSNPRFGMNSRPFRHSYTPLALLARFGLLSVAANLVWAQTAPAGLRSEEHTSELQSQSNLVCRLLLEKKNNYKTYDRHH